MSEEKIARLRKSHLDLLNQFFKEQNIFQDTDEKMTEIQQTSIVIANVMKLDDTLHEMCECGISGAKLRGVSSEEIRGLAEELAKVSEELRNDLVKRDLKVMFLLSQFQLLLRRIIRSVSNMLSPNPLYEFSKSEAKPILTKNVFIVHGRDDKPKLELARILEKLGFYVVILSEQANKGRTIIEKLEQETIDIGCAFVILTPDDMGFQELIQELGKQYPLVSEFVKNRPIVSSLLRPRARQNVILELGYLVGKIGRNRVCCLYKGDVELPSDIHGVLFKRFDKSVEECYKGILDELKAIGYDIKV